MKRIAFTVLFALLIFSAVSAEQAPVEDMTFLSMYFKDEELSVVSATKTLKHIDRVAENITVVMAEDIELMNAHTVAEALYNVTGIEIPVYKGPGDGGAPSIQGSSSARVEIFLDGVPIQNANKAFQLSIMPVGIIRKIEVIKGPASSVWGSSFGGVINIITKSPETGEHFGGTLSASGGEHRTTDVKAELNAGLGAVGIYLYGGRMDSAGILPHRDFYDNTFFSKLNIAAGGRTDIEMSVFLLKSDAVTMDADTHGFNSYLGAINDMSYGKLALNSRPTDNTELNVSLWRVRQDDNLYEKNATTNRWNTGVQPLCTKYGMSGTFSLRYGNQKIVAGAEWSSNKLLQTPPPAEEKQEKYAVFLNDTLLIDKLAIIPGVRFDHSTLGGQFVSPSLGSTYKITRDLIFRASIARGFNEPPITRYIDALGPGYIANPSLGPEQIVSYQAGFEANVVDAVKTKLTLFHHDIDRIIITSYIDNKRTTAVNAGKTESTGEEFEIVTKRTGGFVFQAGFQHERMVIKDFIDPSTFNVSDVYGYNGMLKYYGDGGLMAMLKAHNQWWNRPSMWKADYNDTILDFNIIKQIMKKKDSSAQVFFTADNIFNGKSYSSSVQRNPGRWLETGITYKF